MMTSGQISRRTDEFMSAGYSMGEAIAMAVTVEQVTVYRDVTGPNGVIRPVKA